MRRIFRILPNVLSIRGGRFFVMLFENAVEIGDVVEADALGNVDDGEVGGAEELLGAADAGLVDVFVDRFPRFALEEPAEIFLIVMEDPASS